MSKKFKNILIVDDSATSRTVLERYLHHYDYSVFQVDNGRRAIEFLRNHKDIDLMLSDIYMDEMNVIEMLKICQKAFPRLPVICLTGQSSEELVIEALRFGASDYLMKPFDGQQLLKVIHRIEELESGQHSISQLNKLVDEVKLTFSLTSQEFSADNLQKIIQYNLLNYSNLSQKDVLNLLMALEESLLNAHEHGNLELKSAWKEVYIDSGSQTKFDYMKKQRLNDPQYAKRKIKIEVIINKKQIKFRIADAGKGYETNTISSPDEIKPYGMGLTIIKNLMDEIHFNKKGSCITLTKKFGQKSNHAS